MILGGLSLSEEPISSQRVSPVTGVFSSEKDIPIETSPFLAIEPKHTEWCLEECPLEWSFECPSEWSVNSCDTCN